MKWRVMLELIGSDGIVGVHEVGGRAAVAEYAPRVIGLTLEIGYHHRLRHSPPTRGTNFPS
jgi:hypothetical protein